MGWKVITPEPEPLAEPVAPKGWKIVEPEPQPLSEEGKWVRGAVTPEGTIYESDTGQPARYADQAPGMSKNLLTTKDRIEVQPDLSVRYVNKETGEISTKPFGYYKNDEEAKAALADPYVPIPPDGGPIAPKLTARSNHPVTQPPKGDTGFTTSENEPIIRGPRPTDRPVEEPYRDPLDLVSRAAKGVVKGGYGAVKGMLVDTPKFFLDPLIGLIQSGGDPNAYNDTPYELYNPVTTAASGLYDMLTTHPTDLLGGASTRVRQEGVEALKDPQWWGEAAVDTAANFTLLPIAGRALGAGKGLLPLRAQIAVDRSVSKVVPKYMWKEGMIGAEGRNQGSKMYGGTKIERHMARLKDIPDTGPTNPQQRAALNRALKTIADNDLEIRKWGAGTAEELGSRISRIVNGSGTTAAKISEIMDLQLHTLTNHQLLVDMARMTGRDGHPLVIAPSTTRPTMNASGTAISGGGRGRFGPTASMGIPDGYVQIPRGANLFGEFRGSWVHPDVADVIPTLNRSAEMTNWVNRFVQAWKASKTIWSPNTHLNNVLGDGLFAHLGGVSPFNPLNVGFYQKATQELSAFRRTGKMTAEIREAMNDGAIREGFANMELRRVKGHVDPSTNPFDVLTESRAAQGARDIYDMEDMLFRYAAYLKYKSQGMSGKAAGVEVNKYFPGYSSTSPVGRFTRGPLGGAFTSFPFEVSRIYMTAAKEHPWRMAGAGALMQTMLHRNLAELNMTPEDWQDYRRTLPQGMRHRALLPFKGEHGLEVVDVSNVIPLADMFQMGDSAAASGPGRSLFFGGPAWNAFKLLTNYDWGQGRKIMDPAKGEDAWDFGRAAFKGLAPLPSAIPNAADRISYAAEELPPRPGSDPESVIEALWYSLFPAMDTRTEDELGTAHVIERRSKVSESRRGKSSARRKTLPESRKEQRMQNVLDELLRRRTD